METKKKGRGRPKKTESVNVSKPKGQRGRPKKVDTITVFDISTNEVVKAEKEAFVNHLKPISNFEFVISDANEHSKAYLSSKGNVTLGMKKVQEYYLTNKSFREFIKDIVNGAIQLKALKVAKELDSIV